MSASIRQMIWELATPVVEAAGYDLIEVEYVQEKGWVVRLFIERPNLPIVEGIGVAPGVGVGLEDCVAVSRELSALLDVEEVIPHAFRLEVSSPGARRPLRKVDDFRKFFGCRVRIRTDEVVHAIEPEGAFPSRNILGTLQEVSDEGVRVAVERRIYQIPFAQMTRAHLEPDMEQWMALATHARKDKGE